jgi:hypothetical protein
MLGSLGGGYAVKVPPRGVRSVVAARSPPFKSVSGTLFASSVDA